MDSPQINDSDVVYEISEVDYHGVRCPEAHISDDVSGIGEVDDSGMNSFKASSSSDEPSMITDVNDTDSNEDYVSDEICDICLVKHTEAIQFSLDMHGEVQNDVSSPQHGPLDLLSRSSLSSRSNIRAILTPPSGAQSSTNSNLGAGSECAGLGETLPVAQITPQNSRKKIAFAFDVGIQLLDSEVPSPTTVKTLRSLQMRNINFTFIANHDEKDKMKRTSMPSKY